MGNVNRVVGNTASSVYLAETILQSTIMMLEYIFTHWSVSDMYRYQ